MKEQSVREHTRMALSIAVGMGIITVDQANEVVVTIDKFAEKPELLHGDEKLVNRMRVAHEYLEQLDDARMREAVKAMLAKKR